MKLYCTPRSHFSRKVRILLDAWGVEVTLEDIGNVADANAHGFGPNPLMKVPTLVDDDTVVFDSDTIAAYLVARHDPNDTYAVGTRDLAVLNARAVLNGAMAAEVEVLLARRTGIDTGVYPRFAKHLASIAASLSYLEARAELFAGEPSYLGFHLVSLWEHLAFYGLVELPFLRLAAHVARLSALPYVARSAPR